MTTVIQASELEGTAISHQQPQQQTTNTSSNINNSNTMEPSSYTSSSFSSHINTNAATASEVLHNATEEMKSAVVPSLSAPHHHHHVVANPSASTSTAASCTTLAAATASQLVEEYHQHQAQLMPAQETTTASLEDADDQYYKETVSSIMAKCFLTGYFGGICQAVASHPFDVVKSRIQSGAFNDSRTAISRTLAREGASAFYKGVGPPIAVSGVYNAVIIVCNEAAKVFLVNNYKALHLPEPPASGKDDELPMQYIFLASIMTAPAACAILSPTDVIKIQLQLQQESKGKAKYNGTFDCAIKMVREGGIKTLTRGYLPTLATRVIGLPGYFVGFDIGKKWWKHYVPESSDFVTALAGGSVAGILFWVSCYHLDVVKTKIQAQQVYSTAGGRYTTFYGSTMTIGYNDNPYVYAYGRRKPPQPQRLLTGFEIARQIYMAKGIRGFYTGFGVCMIRAIPANASVFAGIDLGEKWLKKYAGW